MCLLSVGEDCPANVGRLVAAACWAVCLLPVGEDCPGEVGRLGELLGTRQSSVTGGNSVIGSLQFHQFHLKTSGQVDFKAGVRAEIDGLKCFKLNKMDFHRLLGIGVLGFWVSVFASFLWLLRPWLPTII